MRDKSLPLNTDELAIMDESTLRNLFASLKRSIGRSRDDGRRAALETNACYVYREIEIRELRREAHDEWLNSNPQLEVVQLVCPLISAMLAITNC